MNIFKLVTRNLFYYRKKHISVVLGVILSATILIGAMIIGDSVSYSLQKIVYKRLGDVQYALTSGDRVFRQQLSSDLSQKTNVTCSALLYTKGLVISDGGQNRLNNIQFYGVDETFENFSQIHGVYNRLASDEIVVNSYIAAKMNLSEGDEVLLRFEKLDKMPKDSPLADDSEITVAERFKIKFIAGDEKFGRFGLKSEQIAPYNIFLSIDKLASLMDMENKANIMLAGPGPDEMSGLKELNKALNEVWKIEDSGLKLNSFNDVSGIEIRSDRVFLDDPIIEASDHSGINFNEVFTYFVNEISYEINSTPYSFVAAVGPELSNINLKRDEIIINTWTARDLKAKIGSRLQFKYFTVGQNKKLLVDSSHFTVSKIVKMDGIFADKNLLPDYPGLSDSESCMDWHPGIPIDFDKIRKKDELYWENYKGTPKAFIALERAKELWQNRFGKLTAVRFATNDINLLEKRLNENINPSDWNIQFLDVKKTGLEASEQSVDFAGLFLGLSFFVIVSALLLTGMLFLFNIESRSHESGLFLGIGFDQNRVKKIIFSEAGILILSGSLLGCVTGIFYNTIILLALGTVWSDAVGTSALEISIQPLTVVTGFLIVTLLNFVVIWLSVRKSISQSVHSLQRGFTHLDLIKNPKISKYLAISVISFFIAAVLLAVIDPGKGAEVFGFYFITGILVLTSAISLATYSIGKLGSSKQSAVITLFDLAIKELGRKKNRTILLIGLLASSLFIVFTVGINKKNVNPHDRDNKSGTGGYTLFGETSVPVYKDLNNWEFLNAIGIGQDLRFVQLKVKSGDDASCLNLNRVQNPQVISVNPEEFINRDAFSFAELSPDVDIDNPWSVLDKNISENVIYGIADASVIQWQLGKSIGDTLIYRDDSGEELFIVLVAGLENSIFQGNLLISEANFLEKFPSVNGSRMFIAEKWGNNLFETAQQINYSMQDYGLNLSTTAERLAEFNKIENTYLSIFLILGSFGILIGSLGLGLVVFRNIYEQKHEYALLQAVGINKKQIFTIINSAYLLILFSGICVGIIAAVIASLPSLVSAYSEIPYLLISLIILTIVSSGFVSIFFTAKYSLKGNIIKLLRNE